MDSSLTVVPKLFIGIDVHKKSWSVHMRTDICEHKTFTMPPEAGELGDYVLQHFHDHSIEVCYEACCCGFTAARYFLSLGWKVVVVNPADVPRMDKQQYQKTDKIDCRNLCRLLQKEQLRGVYIPCEEQEQLRSLLRQRHHITKLLRKEKTQIKALLLYHGIAIPQQYDNVNWSIAFKNWLQALTWTHPTGKITLESKLKLLQLLHEQYLQIANELRSYCRIHYNKDYYLLKSIPGIGGYLAAALLAELGDIRRFNNERQLSSYIGLVPGIHQSGESNGYMGITPRCNALLRTYLIEAAWVVLRKDPEMQKFYRKHIGKNTKSIIVKIAHKLCCRILAVIKHGQPYQINHSENCKTEQTTLTLN